MPILFAQTAPPPGIAKSIQAAFESLLADFQKFLPGFCGGLVILVVGCILASVLRRLVSTILSKGGLDKLSERIGLKGMLASMGLRLPLSAIIGRALFWILILVFMMTATKVVPGLDTISKVLERFNDYLPQLFSAIIFAMIGLLAAQFVRGAILTSGERLGLDYAQALANLVHGFLTLVVVTLAVGQMQIETELLSKTIQILLAGVALALALALGLGLRPVAQNIAAGVYVRDLFRPGSIVLWDEAEHCVVSISATSVRLERHDGGFLVVPHTEMLGRAVKGRKPGKTT